MKLKQSERKQMFVFVTGHTGHVRV